MKIFISYSHEDEVLKKELLVMLRGIERKEIIEIWHDRKIEPGDIWEKEIKNAMENCDMGLLLISPDFIASEFIHKVELNKLLERRSKEGLLVVPIILRDCLWKDELGLGEILALPRNAKPVIKFPKETGQRDEVWKAIVEYIRRKAGNGSSSAPESPIETTVRKGTTMQSNVELMKEKLAYLEKALILETDAAVKFKLLQEVSELKK